jgi:hypothetical protein
MQNPKNEHCVQYGRFVMGRLEKERVHGSVFVALF